MKKYNKDDVINELIKLVDKPKLQLIVDQRSYLIAILIYNFLLHLTLIFIYQIY